jgi:hypothetical protein
MTDRRTSPGIGVRVLYSTGRGVLQSFMPKIEAKLDVSRVMPQLAIVGLVCLKDELYLCRLWHDHYGG